MKADLIRARVDAGRAQYQRYSQPAIAEALGMTQSMVSKRLSGAQEWRLSELELLAAHLEIPLAELLDDEPASPPNPRADVVAEHLERPVEQVGARR